MLSTTAILAALFVLGSSQHILWPTDIYLDENDVCRDDGYNVWRCRRARHCGALRELYKSGKLSVCSFVDPRNLLVCCPPSEPAQSISERKCQEYKEALCYRTFDYVGPNLRLAGRPPPMLLESVGSVTAQERWDWLPRAEDSREESFIVKPRVSVYGGDPSWAGEHPHMALIGFIPKRNGKILWWCGGSLISERFVLSAAHCAESPIGKPKLVLLGATDIRDKDGPESAMRQQFRIVEQYVYKDYRNTSYYHDIALFRLDRDAKFTFYVAPACLYQERGLPGGRAVVTGWGHNETHGPQMPLLQKATLRYVSDNTCKKKMNKTSVISDGIHQDSQFCAWASRKDTCKGDSGGPLVMDTKDMCLARQVGITSFGPKSCGVTDTPGVYIRVAYYLSWIEAIVWP